MAWEAIFFLSFVVAPGRLRCWRAGTRPERWFGYSLGRMHWMGVICWCGNFAVAPTGVPANIGKSSRFLLRFV